MLDHYLHTAHAANGLLHPHRDPITIPSPVPGVGPGGLAAQAAALAWLDAEYAVLLGAVQLAAATGDHRRAWQLPRALEEFFVRRGLWGDWATTENTALVT